MRKSVLILSFALAVAMFAVPGAADDGAGSDIGGRWHRDNFGNSHEVLICARSPIEVRCRYLQVPEPELGLLPTTSDTTRGHFRGSIVDASACPAHMSDACTANGVVAIARGTAVYTNGWEVAETIVTYDDGSMRLSWDEGWENIGAVGPFSCPWWSTWEDALTNSPDCDGLAFGPEAVDDEASTPIDTKVTIDVLANDAYVGPVVATIQVFPQHGILGIVDIGVFEYTPVSGYIGADSFTYQICDTVGACDTATVTITVGP